MVDAFYGRMDNLAVKLLTKFANGDIKSVTYTVTGGDDYTPGTKTPVRVECVAVVSGVGTDYVDGTQILMSDLMVTMLPIATAPVVGGIMEIDSENHSVKSVSTVPAAGDPIVLKVIVG